MNEIDFDNLKVKLTTLLLRGYSALPYSIKKMLPRSLKESVKGAIDFIKHYDRENQVISGQIKKAVTCITSGAMDEGLKSLLLAKKQSQKRISCPYEGEIHYLLSIVYDLKLNQTFDAKIESYKKAREGGGERSPKIALYTAICGKYDKIRDPLVLQNNIDYHLFADSPVMVTELWQVRPAPFLDEDPTRSARFIKTHPHIFFKDYDIAIWVDGNITLMNDVSPMVADLLASGKPIGAFPHQHRKNIYDEMEACLQLKKDDEQLMREQIKRYQKANFSHDDLAETGFLIFNLKHPNLTSVLDRWWAEIEAGSKRDQLSLNYSLGDFGYRPLAQYPLCIRNHPSLMIAPHASKKRKSISNYFSTSLNDPFDLNVSSDHGFKPYQTFENTSIDVIVCVHNALDDVSLCLESLKKHWSHNSSHRLILIDDGSGGETAAYLREFSTLNSWCLLERSEVGRGYTRAANAGLRMSTGEMVVLLNSDTIVTASWLLKLHNTLFSIQEMGIVGPLSNAASHQSIPDHASKSNQTAINDLPEGMSPEVMNQFCEEFVKFKYRPLVPLIHGFCFAIKRSVIDTIGYFDEDAFPNGYGEENDYCLRASNQGFLMAIAIDTYIYHAKSKSYVSEKRIQYMKSGLQKLFERYSQKRISRAVKTMQNNPILEKIRASSAKFYEQHS